MISVVFPQLPASRKQPVLGFSPDQPGQLLLANLNSFIVDYIARQSVGGISMSFYLLKQLPILPPTIYLAEAPWDTFNASSIAEWLLPRVLELTYTAWDLQPFAQDCGYDGPPFRWDEERRFLLRCELDAAYFHLYGIARDDVDYIMDTFPIVKRKDIAAHGSYRTKETILSIYDEMAAAMAGGPAYPTRLDPPPADPRVAHPPKGAVKSATEVWQLSDLAQMPPPAQPFTVELAAGEAPKAGRYRCLPLDGKAALPDEGALVLVRHPKLVRGNQRVGVAAGTLQLQRAVDATTQAPVYIVRLRGLVPPAEVRLSPDEWAGFRPLGLLMPVNGE